MTECLGASTGSLKPGHSLLPEDEKIKRMRRSGRHNWSTNIRVVDDNGPPVSRDEKSLGHHEVKWPFITAGYLKQNKPSALSKDGWFRTGDIAILDEDGYFEL